LAAELGSLQKAICEEGLEGWLFCNFRHRDKLADEILHIPNSSNSRFWFYAVPAQGDPLKIVHAVEPEALDLLPGRKVSYISREDLKNSLKPLAGSSWGVHFSEQLPAISYLDAGTAELLKSAGLRLVSAASLIQRFKGLLDDEGIASHERAAVHLYGIVKRAWAFVREAHEKGKTIFEGDIQNLILDEFKKANLLTEGTPIVARGENSGNPHYHFSGKGAEIQEGDLVLLDLWAKENHEGAIFADISWAGVFAKEVPEKMEKRFKALLSAREGAVAYIETELTAGRPLEGAAVDRKAREIIGSFGFSEALKHRTGHGIDTEVHGSGVNIDSVEFPDSRLLLEGSCFSLEPGIYFSDFGIRTEINVYIRDGKPHISGPQERQFLLMSCS
jgi:Xaa-Pro aminopeptidase